MKVLYLNPGAQLGGAETSLVELFAGVRAARPDWELRLLTGGEGPLLEEARKLGVATEVLSLPEKLASLGDSGLLQGDSKIGLGLKLAQGAWGAHAYGRQLAKRVEEWKPSVVHATGFKMQILAAAYLFGKTRVLWHIHDYVSWRPLAGRGLKLLARRSHGAMANSHSVADDLRACCPGLPWIEVLYNAVDSASLMSEAPVDLDALSGLAAAPAGTVRLGLVATFAPWKGHEVFLEALAALAPGLPWRAYIIGGPIYQTEGSQHSREKLAALVDKLGLGGRVGLTGFIRERGAAMRALDVVVHATTKAEPFGMVVIEGMACGRPVIVASAGGAAELFEEGVTGLGHRPGDVGGLRARMEQLIASPELRERLGKNGMAHAQVTFSRQNLSQTLTKAYDRLGRA